MPERSPQTVLIYPLSSKGKSRFPREVVTDAYCPLFYFYLSQAHGRTMRGRVSLFRSLEMYSNEQREETEISPEPLPSMLLSKKTGRGQSRGAAAGSRSAPSSLLTHPPSATSSARGVPTSDPQRWVSLWRSGRAFLSFPPRSG